MENTQNSAWNIISNAYIFAVLLITLLFLRVDGKELFVDFFLYATLSRKDIVIKIEEKQYPFRCILS